MILILVLLVGIAQPDFHVEQGNACRNVECGSARR